MESLELLYSCFNQYVFQDAKNNIKDLEYYFETNPSTSNNPLVENLIKAIKTYDFETIGMPLFQSILVKCGKTAAETNKILGDIAQYKQCTKEQMEPTKKLLRDISASIVLQKAGKMFQEHPSDYIEYIKKLNIKTRDESDQLVSTGFGELDVNAMIADGMTTGIPSKFSWINDTFKPECRYPKSGLMLISMPPGTGKTLFAMQECLNMALMGHKVHYMVMGDMVEMDFITRMGAMYYGIPFYEAKQNLTNVYLGLKKALNDNLDITVVPASAVTVEEYIDFIKDKPYEACFVDYDSNFKTSFSSDSMYTVFGEQYAKLSELSVTYHKLVFILAQPMKISWVIDPMATIEIDQVGESARKIHAVDWAMTRTRENGNLNGLGICKIIKSRRGEENVIDYNIRLGSGRFKSVPRDVYDNLRQVKEKRTFTEKDIDAMITSWQQAQQANRMSMANRINNMGGGDSSAQSQFKRASGPNPF